MTFRILICLIVWSFFGNAQSIDSLDYVLGRFEPSKHPDFAVIPSAMANKEGMYLRKEALEAFIQMRDAARKEGVELVIVSATRNFNQQKRIWEAKWNGQRLVNGQNLANTITDQAARAKEILKYSSMPGTSRHHWGTDIDINSVSPSYFESGRGKKEYEWLRDHAYEFGFCQTYTRKDTERPNGYEEEKWHWSYRPISKELLLFYRRNVGQTGLSGFDGANALPYTEVSKYVFGISPTCQ